jgi:hypothetical protein
VLPKSSAGPTNCCKLVEGEAGRYHRDRAPVQAAQPARLQTLEGRPKAEGLVAKVGAVCARGQSSSMKILWPCKPFRLHMILKLFFSAPIQDNQISIITYAIVIGRPRPWGRDRVSTPPAQTYTHSVTTPRPWTAVLWHFNRGAEAGDLLERGCCLGALWLPLAVWSLNAGLLGYGCSE